MTLTSTAKADSTLLTSPVLEDIAATPLYRVVVDTRFEESIAFGEEAQRLGTTISTTQGDVTRLWYEELQPRWRQSPAAIAGLTAHGPLFCLERWAWDYGMRVVFRADHQRRSDGRIQHFVSRAEAQQPLARELALAGGTYPIEVARAVHHCPRGSYQVISPSGVQCGAEDPEPLISWAIAPIEHA